MHFNDGARPTISGVETYYALEHSTALPGLFSWLPFLQRADSAPLTAQRESLAGFIQAALVERTQALNRGATREPFYGTANVRPPQAPVAAGAIPSTRVGSRPQAAA